MLSPLDPGLHAHVVASAGESAAEGERGERVARLAEGREEEPPAPAQTSSAMSRIMRFRSAGSKARGVQMSVPTPAAR
jgi:hypothetical protein